MKAVVLFSLGLDSILATKIIKDLGVKLEAIHFVSEFFPLTKKKKELLSFFKEKLGISLTIKDISQELIEIVKSPRYGYGKNLNPCIDCRILMFKKAKEFMKKINAQFIVSGEVLNERPFSQREEIFTLIEEEVGLEKQTLRPLTAKLLTPTIAEEKGWVDRGRLLGFKGKSRQPQIELAKSLGIYFYPQPAGGCLLTDPAFSKRLRDLMEYKPNFDLKDVKLLKIGRHFRLSSSAKLIILRKKDEKDILKDLSLKEFVQFILDKELISLGIGEFKEKDLELAAQITLSYLDTKMREIKIIDKDKEKKIASFPLPKEKLSLYRIN